MTRYMMLQRMAYAGSGFTSSARSGSPQCFKSTSRTVSRKRTTDGKSVPSGATASSISTEIADQRGNH